MVTFGHHPLTESILVNFLVMDIWFIYNAILSHPTLNALEAFMSIPHLTKKFLSEDL